MVAEDIKISCTYKDLDFTQKFKKEVLEFAPNLKSLLKLYLPLDLTMILTHSNNNNWTINKLKTPALDLFKEDLSRLMFADIEKFNKRDKQVFKMVQEMTGDKQTMEEMVEMRKLYTKDQLQEVVIDQQIIAVDKILNDVIDDKRLFVETDIDSLNGEKLDGKIILKTVKDTGTLIRIKIEYPRILNVKEVTSILKSIDASGDIILDLKGKCINANPTNNINTTSQSNNDDDSINKLKKLKLMFENELITQEEYDEKRKEILDAM